MSQQIKRTSTVNMDEERKAHWGSLNPLSKGISTYELKLDVTTIGRNPQCDIVINDKRLSGKHCKIQKRDSTIIITDMSTNGTFIKNQKIGKGKQKQIANNDQLWLLPPTRVTPEQTLGFKFQLVIAKKDTVNQQKVQQKQKVEEKNQTKKQPQKKDDFSQSLKDQITCVFCFQIMCIPVSVQPCNHRFCGGCLSELIKNKKGQCIQCRKQITTGVRDSMFFSIIQNYLKTHPEDKRADQQQSKKNNIFGHDPIDIYALINGKKKKAEKDTASVALPSSRGRARRVVRVTSDLSASDGEDDGRGRCRECTVARGGFQCSSTQVHVGCFTCGKLIAKRDDPNLHQSCLLCTNYFCSLYFPPCVRTGVQLRLIKDRREECKIDPQVLRANKYQFQGIKNFLMSKKMTSKDLFTYMIENHISKNKFNYIVDRKVMKVPPVVSKQVKILPDSAVCDICWKDLWFQIVLTYRIEIQPQLQSSIRDRPICYWGVNCRTMDHNVDHAQKYNHMCFQSRF